MKKAIFIIILIINSFSLFSQPKNPINQPLTRKGMFDVAFNTTIFFTYLTKPHIVETGFLINPKIDYFIINKFSLGLAYYATQSYFTKISEYNTYFNNGEFNIDYYFYNKPKILMYGGFSYFVGQYKLDTSLDASLKNHKNIGHMFTGGVGICMRLNNHPNLSLNLYLKNFFNLNKPKSAYSPSLMYPIFGLNYFFNRKQKYR